MKTPVFLSWAKATGAVGYRITWNAHGVAHTITVGNGNATSLTLVADVPSGYTSFSVQSYDVAGNYSAAGFAGAVHITLDN